MQGGLNRENWERVITSITKMTVKTISHPGINFLIKHVGSILRRLFSIALADVKTNGELSGKLSLMPDIVQSHLLRFFDEMLWNLMTAAAEKSHLALEPMYSSLDPTIPTFHALNEDDEFDTQDLTQDPQTPCKKESKAYEMAGSIVKKFKAIFSFDGARAKSMLRQEAIQRFTEKNSFLPDERTSMITQKECEFVIGRAYQYIIALVELNNVMLRFQMNHYLYEGFKESLSTFSREALLKDWENVVEPNEEISKQIKSLEGKINGLTESLDEVKRIQSKF